MGINSDQISTLSYLETVFWVIFGIIVSLILPIAVRTLKSSSLERKESLSLLQVLMNSWRKYGGNKYLVIILSAALVATVIVFLLGLEFYTPRDAALSGFAWESLVNKLFGTSLNNSKSD